jgi:putative ABC transport system permease protein
MRIFDIDNWQEIWVAITRNKLRSFLTGFGVFGGIFILVILLGVGNGFEGGILKSFSGFASNSCFFFTDRTSEAYKGYRKGRWWNMNNRDLVLIRERAKTVDEISPIIWGSSGDKNVVNGQKTGSYGVMGVYPAYFVIQQQYVLHGRLFNEVDVNSYRKVCVIGKEVYETLFKKGEDPVGQYIRVNGIYFQVAGVISPKSEISIGGDVESTVFLPFSTMQRAFNQGDIVHFLSCTAKAGVPAADVEEEVKAIIRSAHDISPTDTKAINSFNIEMQFQIFQFLFIGVSFITWFVGLGSLLSGIIGISNIMLITVRERTREIGVRRAIGAKPKTIMAQIISESFVMTAISGIAGLVLGIFVLEVIDRLMVGGTLQIKVMLPPFISFYAAIAAMVVLMVSGIIAGIMPAMRALKIKPIDAIREE